MMNFDEFIQAAKNWLSELQFTPVAITSHDALGLHMGTYRFYRAHSSDGQMEQFGEYLYYAGESDGDDLDEIIGQYVEEQFGFQLSR